AAEVLRGPGGGEEGAEGRLRHPAGDGPAADPVERRVYASGTACAARVPYPLTGSEVCQNARCRVPERGAGGTRKPAQHGATGWHGPWLRRHEHRPATRWK